MQPHHSAYWCWWLSLSLQHHIQYCILTIFLSLTPHTPTFCQWQLSLLSSTSDMQPHRSAYWCWKLSLSQHSILHNNKLSVSDNFVVISTRVAALSFSMLVLVAITVPATPHSILHFHKFSVPGRTEQNRISQLILHVRDNFLCHNWLFFVVIW